MGLLFIATCGVWAILLIVDFVLYTQYRAIGKAISFTVLTQFIYLLGVFSAPFTGLFSVTAAIAALLVLLVFRFFVAKSKHWSFVQVLLMVFIFCGIALVPFQIGSRPVTPGVVLELLLWPVGILCGWLMSYKRVSIS